MTKTTASTSGLTLGHLFEFSVDELTSDLDERFLREFALGEGSQLKPQEQEVLKCRIWSGMTLKSTGEKIGVSPERVRQIQAKGMRKLRFYLLKADPVLAEEQRKLNEVKAKERALEWKKVKQAELDEQFDREKHLPCPNYLFLKRGLDGNLQLEIPIEYLSQFKPVLTATYERWLKEKSKCSEALKELEDCEVES